MKVCAAAARKALGPVPMGLELSPKPQFQVTFKYSFKGRYCGLLCFYTPKVNKQLKRIKFAEQTNISQSTTMLSLPLWDKKHDESCKLSFYNSIT